MPALRDDRFKSNFRHSRSSKWSLGRNEIQIGSDDGVGVRFWVVPMMDWTIRASPCEFMSAWECSHAS
jgi:hypothetical protein